MTDSLGNTSAVWGRVPYIVLEWLPGMTGADAKVYVALCAHANRDWQARPSVQRLAETTGLTPRGVHFAVGRLAAMGAIEVTRGGGRGRANSYRLMISNSEQGFSVSGFTVLPETLNGGVQNPERARPETVKKTDVNPERAFTPTEGTEKEQQQNSAESAAAGCRGADAKAHIRDTLLSAGVGEPVLTELLTNPRISSKLVHEQVSAAQSWGKGVGALVCNLRGALEGEEAKERAERRRKRRYVTQEPILLAHTEPSEADLCQKVDEMRDEELQQKALNVVNGDRVHGNRWRRAIKTHGVRDAVKGIRPLMLRVLSE